MENKPQSERAHELAEFVRGFWKQHRLSYFSDWLRERYDKQGEYYKDIYNIFADEIESLTKPDGMPYPLDKDGIPIKLGDTVYRADGKRPFEYQIFNNCEYGMTVETISLHRDHIEITCDYYGCPVYYEPKQLTHFKPRTLDDIIRELRNAFYEDELRIDLVEEAYELGKKKAE